MSAEESHGMAVMFTVFLFLNLIWFVFSYTLFCRYKDSPLIVNRGFWSVTYQLSGIFLVSVSGNLAFSVFGMKCSNFITVNNIGALTAIVFTIERCVLAIVMYKVAAYSLQYAKKKLEGDGKEAQIAEKKIFKFKKLFHHGPFSYTKLIAWAVIVLAGIVQSMAASNSPVASSVSSTPECRRTEGAVTNVTAGLTGLCVITYLVCLYFLTKINDNFKIVWELKLFRWQVLISLIAIVLNSATRWFGDALADRVTYYIFVPLAQITVCLFLVGMESRSFEKKKRSTRHKSTSSPVATEIHTTPRSPSKPSLGSPKHGKLTKVDMVIVLIKDPELCKAFELFMIQEFSTENLSFLQAVYSFEEVPITAENFEARKKLATHIYREFVADRSQFCINISSTIRQQLRVSFEGDDMVLKESLRANVFDEAKIEIQNLIATDSFRRFNKSPQYQAISEKFVGRLGQKVELEMGSA